jgi:hypothetical protein
MSPRTAHSAMWKYGDLGNDLHQQPPLAAYSTAADTRCGVGVQ